MFYLHFIVTERDDAKNVPTDPTVSVYDGESFLLVVVAPA
jgi:hypothetical protein